jgi:hypothetical protein
VVWDAPTAFVVRLRWRPTDGQADREMFQVLRFADGRIAEMADYRAHGPATKTAKRFAAHGAA